MSDQTRAMSKATKSDANSERSYDGYLRFFKRKDTYHLVERFRTRTMIYGLRWFKVAKGQLQGEVTCFIRAIECFILRNGDLLMRKYAATLNVQSGDRKHRWMHRERDIAACRISLELMAAQARVTRSFIYSMVVDISLYTCCLNFPPK